MKMKIKKSKSTNEEPVQGFSKKRANKAFIGDNIT